jgi:hypothetical protein
MDFSNKLDLTMPDFNIRLNFEGKCVRSLDNNAAIFDDILSTFTHIFNKRNNDRFLRIRTTLVPY